MKLASKIVARAALATAIVAAHTQAEDAETIKELKTRISELENSLNAVADSIEAQAQPSAEKKVHLGGYGEVHYNNLDKNGSDFQELDVHRIVLFVGYDFSERVRLVTEIEVEHAVASSSASGEVELEQAYIELDLRENMHLKTGLILTPVGIINETHEPPVFYGVERPIIENKIIPTTWYATGASFQHTFGNGLSYDLMVSEGLKTDDPTADPGADPFNIRSGRQKGSRAAAYDLATTARVVYRGIAGLEAAVYAQYQPDLDQSAEISYADAATLMGGHAIYQWQDFKFTGLYAQWNLDGDDAANVGKDLQDGGYLEASWKPLEKWGFFVRQSNWSQQEEQDAQQTDFGFNFWPVPDVVFKADYQMQNDDAGNADGFNLGVGWQF